MKIVTTYENSLPITQADAEVVVNTAAALARRGHNVSLVVPAAKAHPANDASVRAFYDVHGPLQIVMQTPPTALAPFDGRLGHGTVERGRQHLSQFWGLPDSPLAVASDLIYTRHIPLALRALRAGRRVFFDHYRPWGDHVPPLQVAIRAMANHPGFLGMAAHSNVAAEAYRRIGMVKDRLRVSFNGFDPRRFEPRLSKEEARAQAHLPKDGVIVTYAGRINEKKGLDVLLKMASALPDVFFVLVGSEGHGTIEGAATTLENVRIFPWQPFAKTATFLFASDVLIIPPSAAPLAIGSTVLPLKAYMYLGAGRAIFAGDTPDIREVFTHDENACLVKAGDVAAATAGLEALISSPERMAKLAAAAARTAAGLTWDARAERIESFLEELLRLPPQTLSPGWTAATWAKECASWLRRGLTEGQWLSGGSS